MVVCLNCRKEGQMVVLTCQHDLCFECAQKIKIAEGVGSYDAKFKICCPSCRKITITLNVQHILKNSSDQLLFVNMQSSQLSEQQLDQFGRDGDLRISQSRLRRMSYSERRNNIYQQRRTPQATKINKGRQSRGDSRGQYKGSQNKGQQVKCSIHKQSLMFFCEQECALMCMQCMYRHMKQQKNHNVSSISDASSIIAKMNIDFKSEAKKKIQQIQKNISICKGNKVKLDQAFQLHQKMIGEDFAELQKLIKIKEQQTRGFLQKVFKRKDQDLSEQMTQLNYYKNCLKQHYQFTIQSSFSQIYFFNAYSMLRAATTKYSIQTKHLKNQQFVPFDKYVQLNDFAQLLDKYYKARDFNRDSKATKKQQSNGPSRTSQKNGSQNVKNKQHFIQQTKKKLQKLNKMENQRTSMKKKNQRQQYLNNFFIQGVDRQLENSIQNRPPSSAMPSYRKSSASQYADKKIGQKTLTPTRITPSSNKQKKK